ncbi:MAG TPA: UDP-glucose/GDP-mannose dehydrogenase family protein [Candidatus Nanoarchaeia archaeon]|nr:UDP-glucose/GDP-mannose dehydrogenase family protein [Candidatus Nanoarchaeia archaeon]
MNISIFGTGYVGLVTGACLANLGHQVLCIDIDASKIKQLAVGKVPFYEPGLSELVAKNREKGRLSFTTDLQEGVRFGEAIFNCVGTPSKEDGAADLSYVFSVAENVAKFAEGSKLLINKSTVPPGTAKSCLEIIRKINPGSEVEVVSNPEFLREGSAIRAFDYPDKIVIGTKSDKAFQIMKKIYSGRLRTYLPIVETDWETAELIKYANNTFLATKISFINEIANICDRIGADVKIVSLALGLDYRISPRFLNPGIGYGGSCFPKDVKAIVNTSKQHNYQARLFEEVIALNERQKQVIIDKIERVYNGNLSGKTFCILGLSFKPKTDDMREAPSIYIIEQLLERGANLRVFDPQALTEAKKIFGDQVSYCGSPEQAAEQSSGIIILTEWDDFRNLNLAKLRQSMVDNKLFDGRNIYEPELVREEGFEYYGMGRN